MPSIQPYSISRVLQAPRKLVFLANADVAHLARWTVPKGSTPLVGSGEVKAGSTYHYGSKSADGTETWGKATYREVTPFERIVHVQSFSDRSGATVPHPLAPTWPLQMLATTTFEELGPKQTKMTITWEPLDADEAALATFDGARKGMDQGWAGYFAELEAHFVATEKELFHSRLISAPRELVWQALTDPAQVNAWWGPDGFKNADVEQDVRVGGVWKFKMIGPDGTEYPNKSTYIELKAPERMVYDCGDFERVHFRGVVTLEELGPGKTLVTLGIVCATKEFRDGALGYAIEGGQQTLAKLDAHVAGMLS